MKHACRHLALGLAALWCSFVLAAPYPTESDLRRAIGAGASVLLSEGMRTEVLDARQEGLPLSLLAAGLNLEDGVCLVFYNPSPAERLNSFFARLDEADMPIWLNAIAVHEATHCFEQREAYLRQHFDKVLPSALKRQDMTVESYLAVVKSGAVETWGEALADIAAILYLQRAVPDRWAYFARGLAALRHDLAAGSPEHDTSPWLRQLIAADIEPGRDGDLFEAAFDLRRRFQPR